MAALSIAAAAAGRDRQGAVARRAADHHGRADVQPDPRRDEPAARGGRVPARRGASRSSTSRTASAKCGTVADRAVVLRDGANAGDARARRADPRQHDRPDGRARHQSWNTSAAGAQSGSDFSVEGLRTRRYPQHAVSFAVGRGEILGMAGLVGAGRSEIARAIFGIEPPVGGTVSLAWAAAADRTARGRHPARDLPRSRGSPARRPRRGFLDSRERLAPGAPQILATRAHRGGSRSGRRSAAVCDQLQVRAPSH